MSEYYEYLAVGGVAVMTVIWLLMTLILIPLNTREETPGVAEENRARKLLYQLLTPAERYQLYTSGGITITGPGCQYVLNSSGIRVYRDGKHIGSLCTISSEALPPSDLMLARLLHLKFNQRAFTTVIAGRL